MLKNIKKDFRNILLVFWAMAVALFWFSMRVIWSGISKVLYEAMGREEPTTFLLNVPLYINIFLWILLAFAVLKLSCRKKTGTVALIVLLGVFTISSAVVVVMGAVDYLYFILPKFFLSLLVGICIAGFAALLFCKPVKSAALKWVLIALVILFAVVEGYGITLGSRFTYEPVVYAVEDTYQIVFSTNHSATAWVEIGGEAYYDLFAGSMKSKDTVHKITVPQEKLDSAKAYSIHAEKMIYRGPFGGFKGKEISKEYIFRHWYRQDGRCTPY